MKVSEVQNYIDNAENLRKMDLKTEYSDDDGNFYVVETKETYEFADEVDADRKIDEMHQDPGFKAAEKKFKAGKVNKAGEVLREDVYLAIIKINR